MQNYGAEPRANSAPVRAAARTHAPIVPLIVSQSIVIDYDSIVTGSDYELTCLFYYEEPLFVGFVLRSYVFSKLKC